MFKSLKFIFFFVCIIYSNFQFHNEIPDIYVNNQLLYNGFLGGTNYAVVRWADWDNDNDNDLFILDEDGRIRFYKNIGDSTNHEFIIYDTNLLSISNITWFYISDFDNDGDNDIITEYDQNPSYVSYYINDNGNFTNLDLIQTSNGSLVISQQGSIPTFCDIDNDGDQDFFTVSLEGTVTFYENVDFINEKPIFSFITNNWQNIIVTGENRHGANAINFIDIDNDNDFDLVWGDYYQSSIYVIWNVGTQYEANMDNINFLNYFPENDPINTVGRNMPTFNDIDGDGDYDLFINVLGGTGGIQLVNNFYFYENLNGEYIYKTDNFLNSIDLISEACPALVDIDYDGDYDLFIGQKFTTESLPYNGRIYFYKNIGSNINPIYELIDNQFLGNDIGTDLCPTFGDIDNDDDFDLVIGTYLGDMIFYENIGNKFNYDFSFHSVLDGGENFWFATPVLADLNFDNKLDILVGNIYGDLRLYYQDQDYNFLLENISYNNINVGYYSAPFFFDIDSDYDLDLVVGGQTRHRLYENIDNNFIEINSDIIPYMGKNAKFTGANLYSSDKFNLISGISTGGVYIASKSTCLRGDLDNNDMINVLDITALVYLILDINYDSNYICSGDINNDFGLNISDIIYLIDLILER